MFLFLFLVALSLGSTIGSSIRTVGSASRCSCIHILTSLQWFFSSKQWYLLETSRVSGRGMRAFSHCQNIANNSHNEGIQRRSADFWTAC